MDMLREREREGDRVPDDDDDDATVVAAIVASKCCLEICHYLRHFLGAATGFASRC